MMLTPTVAIIGRTNVGKSSLFNAILGVRKAVVQDEPGTTRDRNYALVDRFGAPFTLVDTGGVVGEEHSPLHRLVREQAEVALNEADLILAVFDGMHGMHPADSEVVQLIRQADKPVIWIANKCEKPSVQQVAHELYGLGIDELVMVSAAHRRGLKTVIEKIEQLLKAIPTNTQPQEDVVVDRQEIRVAIVGRPNVGKSSLLNKLLGKQRLVTSALAGTTKDEVEVSIEQDDTRFIFVDTAGLRRKSRIDEQSSERVSTMRAVSALKRCDVAILVLDAVEGVMDQDTRIATLVHERGRALIVVVNKWDAMVRDTHTARRFEEGLRNIWPFLGYAPVLFISASTGKNCQEIFKQVQVVFREAQVRLKTSQLNQVLEGAFERNPPPVHRGVPIKMFYASQIGTAPPAMALVMNYPRSISVTYERYLKQAIREQYPFVGSDIKLLLRKRGRRDSAREA